MRIRFLRNAAVAAFIVATPVVAGTAEPPAGDDPSKFFLFHGRVSIDDARADLGFCIAQAMPIQSIRDSMGSAGGLVGALIEARFAEIDRFRMRNAAMRKCMGLLGYDRYQVAQADWKAMVNNGDIVVANSGYPDQAVIERMAAFAAGPAPAYGKLPR